MTLNRQVMRISALIVALTLAVACGKASILEPVSIEVAPAEEFGYRVRLEEVIVDGFAGLHSFAYAQHDGKWLLIGGRTDGLHARQPMFAFPLQYNNTSLVVIDPVQGQQWSMPLSSLSTEIREHLQSTNMNFYQWDDTLIIIGGYAYSESERGHITFPKLTTIRVSDVIEGVVNGRLDPESFGHLVDQRFAVTGGQLGRIGEEFCLVGGQRFDGRYTPMDSRNFTQTYTAEIRRFSLDLSGASPVVQSYSAQKDETHLWRRDYNLVPYIFADGRDGYMISSGVFRRDADLPFLYPVEIDQEHYYPVTGFSQYLSHYHSPKVSLYEESESTLHMIFFGGLAQFYYLNGRLVQDDQVPFVDTVSLVTRTPDGKFTEHVLPIKMPGYRGTSAEFLPNVNLTRSNTGVLLMDDIAGDSILAGHIVGGIISPMQNPFSTSSTYLTAADSAIYEVWFERVK